MRELFFAALAYVCLTGACVLTRHQILSRNFYWLRHPLAPRGGYSFLPPVMGCPQGQIRFRPHSRNIPLVHLRKPDLRF
jgi:hypothetical protein